MPSLYSMPENNFLEHCVTVKKALTDRQELKTRHFDLSSKATAFVTYFVTLSHAWVINKYLSGLAALIANYFSQKCNFHQILFCNY